MAKKALLIMADGCEEIETVTVIDVLRRAGVEVIVAGLSAKNVTGANGIRFIPDTSVDAVQVNHFDMVILPGGGPGVERLRKDSRVSQLLKFAHAENKKIAAICAAPLVLEDAGLLKGKKVTSYPGTRGELKTPEYSTEAVVVDGDLITSRAPGTAMKFAVKLVEILVGKEKSDEVSRATLAFDAR